ncbi:MAG: tetratricopeptide repeat protein [Acidobacteria bacterium]|nr:tetratricopeptide repeat protein [Acidobacteriota bacterium]
MHASLCDQLDQLFSAPDHAVEIGRAALILARLEYPDLDLSAQLEQIELFAAEASRRLPDEYDPFAGIGRLNDYLFGELGFRGNEQDYYDPRNSFLNDVIERRVGIPITLSVVYLEITRRLGLPFYGVGLPGHFLLKYDDNRRAIFIDPFHGGRILEVEDCRDLARSISGRTEVTTEHLRAVTNRQIVIRMLNNLRSIYLRTRQYRKCMVALDAFLILVPGSPETHKQRAFLHHELGHSRQAVEQLEQYLALCPEASDVAEIQKSILGIRRRQVSLN